MHSKVYSSIEKVQQFLFLLLVMSLPWPIRITSALTVLFALACLIPVFKNPVWDSQAIRIVSLCAAYFILHLLYWGLGQNFSAAQWPEVEKKLALLIFPALLLHTQLRSLFQQPLIYKGYVLSVAAACLLCMGIAVQQQGLDFSDTGWYYHAFCKPIQQHAVYFSFQILVAMIVLEQLLKRQIPVVVQVVAFALFGLTLLLLSSKLILVLFFIVLVIWGWKAYRRSIAYRVFYLGFFVWMLLLLAFGVSQIRSRFDDIKMNRLELLDQQEFVPGTYFDGLSLRVLQLKFAGQILQEEKAWLFGVGPFKTQELLNRAYRNAHMYIGQNGGGGYLGLNFHNQYAETMVRFGLLGLTLLAGIMGYMLQLAIRNKSEPFIWIWFLLLLFFLTESVLETHRGLMTMLVLPFLVFTLKLNKQSTYEM